MSRRRLLVTGASGLLGGRLAEILSSSHDVIAVRHRGPVPEGLSVVDADILDHGALDRAFETARPDAVAALRGHGRSAITARAEPDLACAAATSTAARRSRGGAGRGARFVTFSTDLVFGGDRAFVTEDDPPRPSQHYGRTKVEAEDAVLAESGEAAVLRIALVVGRGFGPRTSATEAVASALAAGRRPRLCPRSVPHADRPFASIADAVARVLDRRASGRFPRRGRGAPQPGTRWASAWPACWACAPTSRG